MHLAVILKTFLSILTNTVGCNFKLFIPHSVWQLSCRYGIIYST